VLAVAIIIQLRLMLRSFACLLCHLSVPHIYIKAISIWNELNGPTHLVTSWQWFDFLLRHCPSTPEILVDLEAHIIQEKPNPTCHAFANSGWSNKESGGSLMQCRPRLHPVSIDHTLRQILLVHLHEKPGFRGRSVSQRMRVKRLAVIMHHKRRRSSNNRQARQNLLSHRTSSTINHSTILCKI
jgi:hypothetical protein